MDIENGNDLNEKENDNDNHNDNNHHSDENEMENEMEVKKKRKVKRIKFIMYENQKFDSVKLIAAFLNKSDSAIRSAIKREQNKNENERKYKVEYYGDDEKVSRKVDSSKKKLSGNEYEDCKSSIYLQPSDDYKKLLIFNKNRDKEKDPKNYIPNPMKSKSDHIKELTEKIAGLLDENKDLNDQLNDMKSKNIVLNTGVDKALNMGLRTSALRNTKGYGKLSDDETVAMIENLNKNNNNLKMVNNKLSVLNSQTDDTHSDNNINNTNEL